MRNTDNATIGRPTIVEPGLELGYRYHPDCGPARIGADGILSKGAITYGDVVIGDVFQSGHDIWHPRSAIDTLDWPEDCGQSWEDATK